VDGVDYGTDIAAPDNGTGETDPSAIKPAIIQLAVITSVEAPGEDGQETYSVQCYKPDGSTPQEAKSGLQAWPQVPFQLSVGQRVLVVMPEGAESYVDGASGSNMWPGKIVSTSGGLSTVNVVAPSDYTIAVASLTGVAVYPFDDTYAPEVGSMVVLCWFNNLLDPVILQTGGGAGGRDCYAATRAWGPHFG
jgi:hypothetical protein